MAARVKFRRPLFWSVAAFVVGQVGPMLCVPAHGHSPQRGDGENQQQAGAPASTPDHELERIRTVLTKEIKAILNEAGIPSISIALLRNDGIVWADAFGFSNVKLKVPASPSTVYSTGSCFKSVTAMAVMQLVDRGTLKLDIPINEYLGDHRIKDMSALGKPVTLRHLLSHHSGLKAKHETAAENSEIVPLWERRLPKSLLELVTELNAEDAPGTKHRYSNYGYALAGLVVQNVSGQSYEQYLVENLLKPVGIDMAGPITPTPEMLEELALPYRLEHNKAVPEKPCRLDVYPAGDAYLSVPAMSRLLLLHLNGGKHKGVTLVSETSLAEMHTPQLGSSYGLGVGVKQLGKNRLIMHAGGIPGYSTHFIVDRDARVGVYVASNAGRAHLAMRYLAQLSIDKLSGNEPGAGLMREIVGLGTALAIDEKTGLLRITEIVPNSPASQAGLSAGLMIQKINGISVEGKKLKECLDIMGGPAGTKVRLDLSRPQREGSQTIELPRQKFLMPS
jgi:CubicO group peptidase (beta-lactamase class C family)